MTIKRLVGEIIENFDIDGDTVRIQTQSGRIFLIQHQQDCCESVSIESVDGDVRHLIGKVICEAEEDYPDDAPPEGRGYDSYTWSRYKFVTDDATVVTRWFGESNGYYGETADISEVTYSDYELLPKCLCDSPYGLQKDDWLVISDYWAEHGEEIKAKICRSNAAETN